MAIFKSTNASASYVVSPSSTSAVFTPASVEASVIDFQLVPGHRVTKPGVFTAGTPAEGTIIQIDSNS